MNAIIKPLLILVFVGAPAVRAVTQTVDYDTDIQPILTRSCGSFVCHGLQTSGALLTDYDSVIESVGVQYGQPVIIPGDAAGSPLFNKISQPSPRFGRRMPIGSPSLPEDEIESIRRWIDEGALPSSTLTLARGDFDLNETINISDAVLLLNFLFGGGASPRCSPLVDSNADGAVNVSDAVFLLTHLFAGGPAPAPMTEAEHEECH